MNYYRVKAKSPKGRIETIAALAEDEAGAVAHINMWAPGYAIEQVMLVPIPTVNEDEKVSPEQN